MKRFHYINGYVLRYAPNHLRAFKKQKSGHKGYVYEHILVSEKILNRPLKASEIVHHLDLVRSNNSPENLLVLPRSQHATLHQWINSGLPILGKTRLTKTLKEIEKHERQSHCDYLIAEIPRCKVCKFPLSSKLKKFCCEPCASKHRLKNSGVVRHNLTRKELIRLLKKYSWVKLGKRFNVSDNAVRKWARHFNIDTKKYGSNKLRT